MLRLKPRQNGHHSTDDTFNCIFLNENVWIEIKISLKFFPKGPNNILALVKIMAWCRLGNKPISEQMMVGLLMHVSITQPQWVNNTFMFQSIIRYQCLHMQSNQLSVLNWKQIIIILLLVQDTRPRFIFKIIPDYVLNREWRNSREGKF